MLSISTIWNYDLHRDDRAWLSLIRELGFDAVELSHKTTKAQLEKLIVLIKEMNIPVSSIHNFCPLPDDAPSSRHASNYYRLSSLDEAERFKAAEWTMNTIETAQKVKASVVILHAGTVEIEQDPSDRFFHLYLEGQKDTDEFKDLRQDILEKRQKACGPYLTAVQKSLKHILPYAQEKNIKVALETRYYPFEIPNIEEFGMLFDSFPDHDLFYWHDVGHAEINARVGITSPGAFLEKYQPKLIGMHLHDMKGRRDHQAPFQGDIDFNKIFPYLKDNIVQVVEPVFASSEELSQAVTKLRIQ